MATSRFMKTSAEMRAHHQERALTRSADRGMHCPRMYCPVCRLGFMDEERYKEHYRTRHTAEGRR